MKYEATHKLLFRGHIFFCFNEPKGVVYSEDMSTVVGGNWSRERLEKLGYVLEPIVITLENE